MASNAKMTGPERWVAMAETRKREKREIEQNQAARAARPQKLNLASGSQYFVEKYPLAEKTREEWTAILEKRKALQAK